MAKKPQAEFFSPTLPNSHPLQARNPQQPQAQLEGVGAEAAQGQAGGPAALGTGTRTQKLLGPKGGSATMDYIHAINRGPTE